jgi:hypothetical protein
LLNLNHFTYLFPFLPAMITAYCKSFLLKRTCCFFIVLGALFAPHLAYPQAWQDYEPTKGMLPEPVLKKYLARSMFLTGMVDITPLLTYHCSSDPTAANAPIEQAEYNRWLRFIKDNHPKMILGMSGIWEWNAYFYRPSFCGDDHFARCSTVVAAMHAIDPQIICEAALDEWVNPDLSATSGNYSIQIPAYVVDDLGLPVSLKGAYFEARDMRRDDIDAPRNFPDIAKNKMIAWDYWLGTKYIDTGFESIRVGQAGSISVNDLNNANIGKLFTALRKYAKMHGRRNFVLISGGTPRPYYTSAGTKQLLFDFQTARVNAIHLLSADHGVLAYGDGLHTEYHDYAAIVNQLAIQNNEGILGRSPGGISPQGWTTAHSPFIVEIDNSASDTSAAPTDRDTKRYGFPWAWDESTWFSQQSELYRNHWLQYAWHRTRCIDPNGYLAFNGRRPRTPFPGHSKQKTSPPDLNSTYRAYTIDRLPSLIPRGYNQEATIKALWDSQEAISTKYVRWANDFNVLRSSSLAAIIGKKTYGDFNGDGYLDVLETADNLKGQQWVGWRMYLYKASGNSYVYNSSASTSPSWTDRVYVGDFNGDHKDDVIYTADRLQGGYWQGWEMRLSSVSINGEVVLTTSGRGSFPSWQQTLLVGHFDRDTRADLVVTTNRLTNPSGPEGYTILLAAAKFASSPKQGIIGHSNSFKGSGERLYAGDFNGDGLDDILVTSDRATSSPPELWDGYSIYHCISKAAGISFEKKAANNWPSWGEKFALGDWNQDGRCDFTVTASDNTWGSKTYLSNETGTHFIYAFEQDGIQNVQTIFSYQNSNTPVKTWELQVIVGDNLVTYTPQYCATSKEGIMR